MSALACKACAFFFGEDNRQQGQCRAEPPKAHFVPIPQAPGLAGANEVRMQLAPVSVFPTVTTDAWCGAFEPLEAETGTDAPAELGGKPL